MKKMMILAMMMVSISAAASNSWPTTAETGKYPSWPSEGVAKLPAESVAKFPKFPREPKFPSCPSWTIASWPSC